MNNNKFIDLNLYSSVINLIANRTTTAKILEDLIKAYIYIYIYIYTHAITSTWRLTKAIAEMKCDTEQTMKLE